jgi:type IV secretory pathway TraG/TraD family ATPase VirD4
MGSEWGRKETIIWPPHAPVFTYGALLLALIFTSFFAWERFRFSQSTIERSYTGAYIRSEIGSLFHRDEEYRLIYLGSVRRAPRLAVPADFEAGETVVGNGRIIPVKLSEAAYAQGFGFFYRGPEKSYVDTSMYQWLRGTIFDGKGLYQIYRLSLFEGLFTLVLMLYLAIPRDLQRFKEMKYGRRLKGPVMLSPKEFRKTVKGTGVGFKTTEMKTLMRVPVRNEAQHFQLLGDTGAGKTTLIMQVLRQIQGRGDSAIVYDPACEYIQRFYNKDRGDIVLNPLDARSPYWGPAEEIQRNAEADAIAASLYQPTTDQRDEFFHETPAQIFAHLLKQGPSPHQLAQWMASASEIEARVAGTEMEHYIGLKAGPQRQGVLSSLGLVAKSFRLLPTKEQAGNRVWSATSWAEHRKGWIFITSRPSERVALRPLHSLWIDLLVMRLLSKPQPNQKQVWFVIDELASLQRLPQLHTAVTENRKSKNPLVLGFQGKSQLEVIYGHLAEVMLSQPATKIFLRTTEPKAAEWVSNAIGKVEIERVKETKFDGTRSGKNFTLDRQIEPLVMDSEIEGLSDRHAYLKLGNNVVHFSFDYLDLPHHAPEFIPRNLLEDELSYDPRTLEKRKPQAGTEIKSKPVRVPSNGQIIPPVVAPNADKPHEQVSSDADESPRAIEAEAALVSDEVTATAEDSGGDDDGRAQIENSLVVGGF